MELFKQGAGMYVCSFSGVGEGVKKMVKKICLDAAAEHGKELSDVNADESFEEIKRERFYSDVFTWEIFARTEYFFRMSLFI